LNGWRYGGFFSPYIHTHWVVLIHEGNWIHSY
jgi:hypothetical protein